METRNVNRTKPGYHSCVDCKHLLGCGPLRMAINTPNRPCDEYEKDKGIMINEKTYSD